MKKELIDKTINDATSATGQGPAPTGQWIKVVGFCRSPGHCYPGDEYAATVDPTADANDLIKLLTQGFFVYWFPLNDPNITALIAAAKQQWLSTVKQP